MEVNGVNKRGRKRLSIITDAIIFFVILSVFLLGIKCFRSDLVVTQNLALEDINVMDKNYIEVKYIKEKYGINVIYGKDTCELTKKVEANVQENGEIIYENILSIEDALKKYPDSFFVNNNLTIVIVNSFNNNNIALASKNKLNEFKIYISNNKNFERSLHHEMYHIFEYKLNNSDAFADWKKYDPINFDYLGNSEKLDDTYVYKAFADESTIYFATKYSKVSEKEDRAEIFAEIMTFKIKPEFLIGETNMYKKAKYIVSVMNNSLSDSNKLSFYWNRF